MKQPYRRSVSHRTAPVFRLRPLTRQLRIALLQSLVLAAPPFAVWAGPQGGRVVAGAGSVSHPNAATTLVQQHSVRLALDWQSFDVARHELVEFKQPNAQAEALNRIFDQRGSEILGHIKSNGRVLLMNPNGVLFGPSAQVNVNGLVAAGLQVDVADFMRGQYTLSGQDHASGVVVNQGLIAAAGGEVALIGKQVRNEGVIVADLGRVELLGGDTVAVDFDGDGLLRFAVVDGVLENSSGGDSAVSNTGTITADGGTVVMAAKTAREVFSQAVNNTGVIRAGRIAKQGGQIKLVGLGPDAAVTNSGRLDGSARDQGDGGSVFIDADGKTTVGRGAVVEARGGARGSGGDIQITGREVKVAASEIDASGGHGGGQILVGGGARGADPRVRNALTTTVDAGATLKVNAEAAGDGGNVVVWADDTRFAGHIEARGGVASGNGGLAEISGKQQIVLTGHADLTALRGAFGRLLIDPGSVTIQDGPDDASNEGPNTFNDAFVAAQLELGDLTIATGDATNALAPTITINGDVDVTWTAATLFELVAGSDASVGGTISNLNGAMRIDFGQDDVDSTLDFTSALVTLDHLDINGAAGDDTIDFGTATIALADSSFAGGDGADTFDFSGVTISNSGNSGIDGGAGTNTLIGATDNTFSIDGADQGALTFSGQTIDFTAISDLAGGAGSDAFVFADGASLSGTIDGAAGSDTLSFAGVTTARALTLNNIGTTDGFRGQEAAINAGGANGFNNIDVLIGSSATDTLNGRGGTATWALAATKQYTNGNALTFDAIENLQGSSGADTFNVSQDHTGDLLGGSNNDNFNFTGSAVLTGAVRGEAGNDSLSFTGYGSAVSVLDKGSGGKGDVTGTPDPIVAAPDDFVGIESVTGVGGVTAPNGQNNTWNITGVDAFTLSGIGYTNVTVAIGGDQIDTFTIQNGGRLTGATAINGGAGNDVLATVAAGSFTLTGNSAGSLTTAGLTTTFTSVEDLAGGTNADNFIFNGAFSIRALDGGAGTDAINWSSIGSARSVAITVLDATGADGSDASVTTGFRNIESLRALAGSSLSGPNASSTWTIGGVDNNSDDGTLASGGGSLTFIDFATLTGGSGTDSITLTSGVLTGALAGGAGTDTLTGSNSANSWTINASNGGRVTGIAGAFSGIENLTGNAQDDTFAFVGNGAVSGAIIGAAQATEDLFDFSAATAPVTVNSATLNGIERLIGSPGSDILIGTGGADTFNVVGANTGDLGALLFSSFENLQGAAGPDSFLFAAAGSVSGVISGGSGSDVLNLSARAGTTASLSANSASGYDGSASGTGGFNGIDTLNASNAGSADSLSGMNTTATWGLAATSRYTDNANARFLDFTGFEVLAGGAGTDEIRAPASDTQFSLTGGGAGSVAGGASAIFTQIENLTGNTGTDTFTVTGSHTGDLSGAAGADSFQLAGALDGAIDGGANDDTLAFAGGSLSGTFAGGSGTDTIDYSGTAAPVSVDLAVHSAPLINGGTPSGFSAVEQLIGSSAIDTLIGTAGADTFTVTGLNTGALAGVLAQFTSFERLHGGAGDDRFEFADGAAVVAIDGGTASTRDVLDLTAYTSALTWTFAATNSLAFGMSFANIEAFMGGFGNDDFVVQNGGSLVLSGAAPHLIDGGAGFNSVSYAATASAVTVELGALVNIAALTGGSGDDQLIGTSSADQFETSGPNQGCLPTCTAPALTYASFENLDGADGADSFVIRHAVEGAVDGGAGNDRFVVLDTVTSGDLDGGADDDTFELGDAGTAVVLTADLIGGAEDDTFRFFQDSRLVGEIQGALGFDTIDLTGSTLVQDIETIGVGTSGSGVFGTITNAAPPAGDLLSGAYDNIDDIQGNANALSTLVGNLTSDNTWVISGNNSGTLNGVSFSNFKLLGGTAVDTFTFTNAGSISNGIDGGAGGIDVVVGAAAGALFVITGDTTGFLDPDNAGGTASTAFIRIDQLLGGAGNDAFELTGTFDGSVDGAAGTDTLTADNTINTWTITGLAAGVVTGLAGGFSSIERLEGGSAADTFAMTGASFAGQIAGNGGVDELHGDDIANTWNLSGANAGNLAGVAAFSTIENLVGGAAADRFVFSNAAQFERLDGALGVDVLDYAAVTSGAVTINLLTSQASLVNDQALNLEQVLGSTSAADILVGDDTGNTWTLTGLNLGNVDGFAFSGIENLIGGTGSDQFRLTSAVKVVTGSIDGGLGTDRISNQGVTNAWNITGIGAGTVNNNAFVEIENLTALNANATLSFGGDGSLTGTFTADTVTLTTPAVNTADTNFVVAGDLVSNGTRSVNAGHGRFSVSGAVTSAGGLAVTTANAAITIGDAVNTNGATSFEAGSGAITLRGAINTAGNPLRADGGAIDLAGPVQARTLAIAGDATLRRTIATNGAQTYSGSQRFFGDLTGASLRFSGNTNFTGSVLLEASSNLVDFNDPIGGTGNLTINPTLDTEIVFDGSDGPGHLAAGAFHNFAGHLIVGGRLDPSDPPAENAAVLEINAKRISILQDVITNGSVTLLASNIDLLANLGANLDTGQVTLLAVGDTQGFGEPDGDITGPASGVVTITGSRAVLIANNTIPNNQNIALDLGGGSLLVAVAAGQDQPSFDPSSNAVSESFDPNALALISSLTNPIGVQAVQVVFTNPAAALTGLQNVQFIDLGVFEQELSLFGVIGNGIALSLDQCEELEGCAPNVSASDLTTLIATLEGRIAELEQRQGRGELGTEEAARLLLAYRTELANYQGYQHQLQEYQEAEESVSEDFEELEGENFEATPAENPETAPATPAEAPAEVLDEDFEELDDVDLTPELAPEAPVLEANPAQPAEFEELDEGIEPAPAADPLLEPAPEFEGPEDNPEEFEELEEELDVSEPLSAGSKPAHQNTGGA